MAEQNCAHSGCNCKVQQGKGVARGATHSVANFAPMLRPWLQANANVSTRVASKIARGGRFNVVLPPHKSELQKACGVWSWHNNGDHL